MSTTPSNTFSLRSVLEKDKLNGSNFLDWYRNLRIVLKQERKDYVLMKVLPERLGSNASHAVRDAWNKHYDDMVDVRGLMLATMNSKLRKQFKEVESPIEIITNLKGMFQGQVRVGRYQTVKSLYEYKLPEHSPVGPHVMRMMNYIDNLARLDNPISQELAIYTILQSLPPSYDQFVKDYNDSNLSISLTELHDMLKKVEANIKNNTPTVPLVHEDKRFEKPGEVQAGQIVNLNKPADDVEECQYCKQAGHEKNDCEKFQEDLEEIEKMYGTSSKGTYVSSKCYYFRF